MPSTTFSCICVCASTLHTREPLNRSGGRSSETAELAWAADSRKLRLPMALSHLSPLRHQWARPQSSVFRVRRSSGQSVFFRYFDMRCEHSKVVCDGKVMALLTKWKKVGSFKPHTIEKLKSILPNSKIDLVQLLAFSKLAKKEMKRGEKPTKMQKILHHLSVLQHLTLAIHFAEGVLCLNRY